jgi:hypothetical protein
MVQQSDIVERIDELTEPGPDAATWTATPQDTPRWDVSEPYMMKAVLLGVL